MPNRPPVSPPEGDFAADETRLLALEKSVSNVLDRLDTLDGLFEKISNLPAGVLPEDVSRLAEKVENLSREIKAIGDAVRGLNTARLGAKDNSVSMTDIVYTMRALHDRIYGQGSFVLLSPPDTDARDKSTGGPVAGEVVD